MQPSEFSTYGAVDLGARKAALEREAQRQAAAEAGNTNPYAVDVTEENFQREVLERSLQVPVVLVLLAGWSGESKQTEQALDKLVAESQGQWLLAKIDTGVSPQLTQALRAQAVPALYLALGGQIQPIAVGAINENQARDLLTQVFSALRQQGVLPQNFTGVGPAQPAEQQPKHNPVQAKAAEAVQRGDFAAAEAAYTEALEKDPRNADYTMGLAQVRLLARVRDLDVKKVRQQAADNPTDVAAQCAVADLDMYAGNVEDAFDRLVATVRRTSDDDRDRARKHLLGLFEMLPAGDPRVAKARRNLTSALF
ncbi:tetratricopeptide repeat protein [Thermobifida fusca]|jgi:putative thioredoxin|uniref:Thioredoxin n=2 Tax=Thermobifida fusca TaxID=2021 RepID=A0A9P2T889_THEFU|nr:MULTISPECIES: tetratricopeptide repeat protein [Thermobifida]AAZ56425.1 putative thioredoxin [Thermobifida fusca YX]EOR70509.1 thioredoxin [Thermobifida fusca TM51]MBO2530383.1 co-chaperone YbbN [Thermobifida sp.]PPS91791.1 thioredoxin [Thermobifida fusca]PZN60731.1 MAG: co-chaperone YbbN [Thermobifida fusca]